MVDFADRGAQNAFGVIVKPQIVAPGAPINTQTKTYHGLVIQVDNISVGRIQSWAPQMYSRGGTHIFEIGLRTYGRPVDYVPGPGQGYSLTCSRTEVWNNELEFAMGAGREFTDLVEQKDPFKITEVLFGPSLTGPTSSDPSAQAQPVIYRVWTYYNCWFAEKNLEPYSAEGNAKMVANATINFVSRIRSL